MGDLIIVEELKGQLTRNLKQVKQVTWFLKGYQLNDEGFVTHLSISKFKLDGQWPKALFKLKYLEYLDMQENNLVSIPEDIAELQNLTCIDLRLNHISVLPESIAHIPSLKKLYLGNNAFQEIPAVVGKCPALELIDFSNNIVYDGCEHLLKSKSIANIYLKNNGLQSFPFNKIGRNRIKELNLMENNIDNYPTKIKNIEKLYR